MSGKGRIVQIGAPFAAALLWLWTGAKVLMDWIGRSTISDDAAHAISIVEKAANWLLTTPWWVPTGLAVIVTGALTWYARPRRDPVREVVHYISHSDIPHIVRDFVVARDCTKIWQDSGRVTFILPRRLRCQPTVITPHGFSDVYAVEAIESDCVTFKPLARDWQRHRRYVSEADIMFDALSDDQTRILSHKLGIHENDGPKLHKVLSSVLLDETKSLPYLLKLLGES